MEQCPNCGGTNIERDYDTLEYVPGFRFCRDCGEEFLSGDAWQPVPDIEIDDLSDEEVAYWLSEELEQDDERFDKPSDPMWSEPY